METFLDFLTENYIYFLIAAGVLILALIGLIVSSKKKGKEENHEVENALPSETVETPTNTIVSEPVQEQPSVQPVEQAQQPEETLDFKTTEPTPAPPVEPIHETPATIDNTAKTYDDPIMQIDQTSNNNFKVDQNNNNNNNM